MDSSLEPTRIAQKHGSYIGSMLITQWFYIARRFLK